MSNVFASLNDAANDAAITSALGLTLECSTMGILNRLRDTLSQPSIDDAHLYAVVAKEIAAGQMREGLWAKALAESNFDDSKARALYMRMAVKALVQEQQGQQEAMDNAFTRYDNRQYSEALYGLFLLLERKENALAAACLANIGWHGLTGEAPDRDFALKLLSFAETSTNPYTRRFVGSVYEAIDWRKSLANYDFAAQNGDTGAADAARDLRKRLLKQRIPFPGPPAPR